MSTSSGPYLEPLRLFLNKECIWRKTGKGAKHREYRCLSSSSPWSILPHQAARRVWKYEINIIIVKKRNDDYIISMAIEGLHYQQILCPKVVTQLFFILHSHGGAKFYKLTFDSFKPMDAELAVPLYDTTPLPHMTMQGLSIYDHCSIVGKPICAQVAGSITPIGTCGVWTVTTGAQTNIVCFALRYDLAVCISDPKVFPSMARCMASAVGCAQDTCSYCTGHNKHVEVFDVNGDYGKNKELCFCSTPCGDWDFRDESMKPLFSKNDEMVGIRVREPPNSENTIFAKASDYFYGITRDGKEVGLSDENFILLKIDPRLSHMIIVACPILKRMCMMKS
ncbi:tegument protein UL16 [Elephant endotheliotropic herpesvirus 1A]|uniref:Protein U65 n=1 Tax=Elephant endotheliotropic herpesvirus 1A TaxID=759753 RepID=A0A5J6RFB2_ELHV1|nr:tegument protein UL16 [Elephant endotheliotropic herpesvirus 1A]QOE74964.1 protein U65 [Elephant endotheliotropic herpesvirus 1A]